MDFKIAYGEKENLNTAIENGVIDGGDIAFLNNGETIFMKDDKTPLFVTPRTQEEIVVNGVKGLGIEDGVAIPSGKSLDEIIKMLVQKSVPAIYTAPSITVKVIDNRVSGYMEAGSTISPKFNVKFIKNDAGNLDNIKIYKNDSVVGESKDSNYNFIEDSFLIGDEEISYYAHATYAEGNVKKDNLGNDSPNGHIIAGTVISTPYKICGARNMFYGTGIGELKELTSDLIRNLDNSKLNPVHGYSFNLSVNIGQQYIIIAYPSSLRDISNITYVEANDNGMVENFEKHMINVADNRGENNGFMEYKVFTYQMAMPAAANMTFKITL